MPEVIDESCPSGEVGGYVGLLAGRSRPKIEPQHSAPVGWTADFRITGSTGPADRLLARIGSFMVLYHLDVGRRLQEGMRIELSNDSLSLLGKNYISKFRRYGVLEALEKGRLPATLDRLDAATFREWALEFLRRHYAPVMSLNRPSRLSSFFATATPDDALRYADRHKHQGERRVFEVQAPGEHPYLDMTWLDRTFPKSISSSVVYHLERYWIGELFESDPHLSKNDDRSSLREYLVTVPITIGRRV